MILGGLIGAIQVVFAVVLALVAIRVLLYRTGFVFIANRWWRRIEDCFHVHQSFKVLEFNVDGMQPNQLYRKVNAYLSSLPSAEDADFTNLFTAAAKPNEILLRLDPNQVVHDNFLGAKLSWINVVEDVDGTPNAQTINIPCRRRTLILKIRKADKRRILRPYLQHIHAVSDELDQRKRPELKLYMNFKCNGASCCSNSAAARWRSIPFTHPSTFDTIAMETDLKNKVKSDLEAFLKAKQYYHRLGRVWKRSFLLYGPSGTGKSSFVAAMANFLSYDVYDIDLSQVSDDSDLGMLLLQTTSKSVVVIEDLDRYLMDKQSGGGGEAAGVSLSGMLNFMDGIVNSCCAEERVMVFTMNVKRKEHVEPAAILRPGRVDVHIHFPLCDFSAFKTLANSYLGVKDHKLFAQVEEHFQNGASLSPAEMGELMIANRSSPSRALKTVITALQTDGDGRGSTAKTGRRSCENEEYSSRKSAAAEEPQTTVESCGFFSNEGIPPVKELRKLYGLLRMKTSSRKSQSLDMSTTWDQKDG